MPPVTHTPTAQEQMLLEYLNLLRQDPGGEFDRLVTDPGRGTGAQRNITEAMVYFGVSIDALRSQLGSFAAVSPLAWNGALALSSERHTQLMIAADLQSHLLPGEADLGARITAAGYTRWTRLGENVYAHTHDPLYTHAGFVIDWGYDTGDLQDGRLVSGWQSRGDGIQDPAGHRITMLDARFTEVGMAMLAENNPATAVGPFLVTQNFGTRAGYAAQLLGVVIADADGDAFYDIGEGLAGVTVTATGAAGTFTTTSWGSGGYQMELPAGSYTVGFSGGGLVGTARYSISLGGQNVKLDALASDARTAPEGQRLFGRLAEADSLSGGDGPDRLFGDGFRPAQDLDAALAVYRLYQATLDRVPDTAGHQDWTRLLATEARSLTEVATGFVSSREFAAVYGTLSDPAFVDLLYRNVLDRAPDQGGLAGWTQSLATGTSRAEVVTGFSQSAEFRSLTAAAATQFTATRDPAAWQDDVFRLYQATLGRDPDAGGFKAWIASLGTGVPLAEVVSGFVDSAEFRNRFGAQDDAGFVTLLYRNVLDRAPDGAGLDHWVEALATGQGRAQVVQGFLQSAEFVAATTTPLKLWIRAQGQEDSLAGGGGDNALWGGAMADVFRFEQADRGTHRVMDFEPWDYLDFNGFGYGSGAEVRAQMTQNGADVIFSDQGTLVTLANTQLGGIDTDTFLL